MDVPSLCREYGITPNIFISLSGDDGDAPDGTFSFRVTKDEKSGYHIKARWVAEWFTKDTMERLIDLYRMITAGFVEGKKLKDIVLADDSVVSEMFMYD